MKSPDLEVNVLTSMENVTPRVQEAVNKAVTPEAQFGARRATIAQLERESQEKTGLRSDVVTLYQGGEYWLYRYKKYTDVRLVFAPENSIAFFGGDPDNFTYPRYDLDLALFRVYENGRPIESKNYLKWNAQGAAEGDLVFLAGHPGSTSRLDTMAQLMYLRDVGEPETIKILTNRVDTLQRYSATGSEPARQAASQIFNLQNSLKASKGIYRGLLDPAIMAKKQREEDDFKSKVMANPEWKAAYGGAWQAIAEAERKLASRSKERMFHAMDSQLANLAMTIVQYVAEVKKPDGDRLPGYHDAQLDSLKFQLFSPAPIYPRMEIARITGALTLDLAEAGPDDPFLKTILGGRTPAKAAAELVEGSKLADTGLRRKLIDGGQAAVAASTDPMIVLAPPTTTFYGLYDRADGFGRKPPYNLPERYAAAPGKLNLATPFDFVTTTDVVGGNSGSPVIDRNANLVGLVFDGTIESLIGDFVYDGETNRTVSVQTAAMTEALRKIYNAPALVNELLGQ
jgi:hypothetical protein